MIELVEQIQFPIPIHWKQLYHLRIFFQINITLNVLNVWNAWNAFNTVYEIQTVHEIQALEYRYGNVYSYSLILKKKHTSTTIICLMTLRHIFYVSSEAHALQPNKAPKCKARSHKDHTIA